MCRYGQLCVSHPATAIKLGGTTNVFYGNYCDWFFLLILSFILLFTLHRSGRRTRGWLLPAQSCLLRLRCHQTGAHESAGWRAVQMGWLTSSYWRPAARSEAVRPGDCQSCRRSLQINPTHYKDPRFRRGQSGGQSFASVHKASVVGTAAATSAAGTRGTDSSWSWQCLPDSVTARGRTSREWIVVMLHWPKIGASSRAVATCWAQDVVAKESKFDAAQQGTSIVNYLPTA